MFIDMLDICFYLTIRNYLKEFYFRKLALINTFYNSFDFQRTKNAT